MACFSDLRSRNKGQRTFFSNEPFVGNKRFLLFKINSKITIHPKSSNDAIVIVIQYKFCCDFTMVHTCVFTLYMNLLTFTDLRNWKVYIFHKFMDIINFSILFLSSFVKMHRYAKFQAPLSAVDFLCSCEGL